MARQGRGGERSAQTTRASASRGRGDQPSDDTFFSIAAGAQSAPGSIGQPHANELVRLSDVLHELDGFVLEELGIGFISHEFRLLIQLIKNSSLTVKGAMLSSRLSERAFHELLKRLEANSIIELSKNSEDGRSKRVKLSSDAASKFAAFAFSNDLFGTF